MALLGMAQSLVLLFVARLWSGIATANIAVAQAYIADVTPPERRARGMGIIGMGFGLGFIIGPFAGGALGRVLIHGRPGALAAFVAAGLSLVNLVFALIDPARIAAARGARQIEAADEPARLQATARCRRAARRGPGDRDQLQHGLLVRRHGADVSAVHRGPLRHERLADRPDLRPGRHRRRHGSGRAHRAAVAPLRRRAPLALPGCSFRRWPSACWASARRWAASRWLGLFASAGLIAFGNGLCTPTLPAFVSRRAGADSQGVTLGSLQSASALARVLGPAAGGVLYQALNPSAPYYLGALGMIARRPARLALAAQSA